MYSDQAVRLMVDSTAICYCGDMIPRDVFFSCFVRRRARKLVGARGFEPPTSASRTLRATRLRYAPFASLIIK